MLARSSDLAQQLVDVSTSYWSNRFQPRCFQPAEKESVAANMFQTLLISLILLPQTQDKREFQREWEGTMDIGSGRTITLRITSWNEDGKPRASFRRINPDGQEIQFDSFETDGQDVVMKVKQADVDMEFRGTVNADLTEAKGTWKQAGREFPLTLRPAVDGEPVEAWVGEFNDGIKDLKLQFRILETPDGKRLVKFDTLTEGFTGFEAVVDRKKGDPNVTFTVPSLSARFEGKLDRLGEMATGIWIQKNMEFPTVFKRIKEPITTFEPPKPLPRPQTPSEPFRYEIREVQFKNGIDDVTLSGTLTLPSGDGKYPVAVLISGSGPQDRDETLFEHKPFLLIADTLTKAGIGVLRYDDRGIGKSTGDFNAASTLDFANDTRAAVAFLRTQPQIDTSAIGMIGHSEGGLIAPMVAAEDSEIAFVIMLAGPGLNGFEILKDQGRRMAAAEGIAADQIQKESELRDEVANAVRTAATYETTDLERVVEDTINSYVARQPVEQQAELRPDATQVQAFKTLATPWFRFFLRHEPATVLKKVKCPVLALNGERDLQVWHETNLPAIAKALREGGNDQFRAVRLPGLNHLFQRCRTGAASEYVEIEQTMAGTVLDLMSGWIKKTVGRK